MSHNRRSCLGMRPKAALSSNLSTGPYPYPPTCQRTFQACTLGAACRRHNNPSSPFLNTASRGLPARAQVTFACDGKRSNETAPPKQNRLERGTQILRDSANKALAGPPALLSIVIGHGF